MIKSMTGYGRADKKVELRDYQIEIKSVNHKYLDITIKMPKNITGAAVSVSYKRDFAPFAFFDQRERIIFATNRLKKTVINIHILIPITMRPAYCFSEPFIVYFYLNALFRIL